MLFLQRPPEHPFSHPMKTLEKKNTKATKATTKKSKLVSLDRTTREIKTVEKWVRASLMVPKEYATLLSKPGRCARIGAATVWSHDEEERIRQWKRARRTCWGVSASRKSLLEEILKLDLDTEMTIAIPAEEWPHIKSVCKTLGISTCDWLLASVQYAAQYQIEKAKEKGAA